MCIQQCSTCKVGPNWLKAVYLYIEGLKCRFVSVFVLRIVLEINIEVEQVMMSETVLCFCVLLLFSNAINIWHLVYTCVCRLSVWNVLWKKTLVFIAVLNRLCTNRVKDCKACFVYNRTLVTVCQSPSNNMAAATALLFLAIVFLSPTDRFKTQCLLYCAS